MSAAFCGHCSELRWDRHYNPMTDAWKPKAIAKSARYADRIYALNPDLLDVLPPQARFLPYANVDPREWTPLSADTQYDPGCRACSYASRG